MQRLNGQGRLKPPRANVHRFIKLIAAKNPMTYQALAQKSGVHYSTIQRWRHHGNTPLLADIEAVLTVLGYELVVVKKHTAEVTK